jgi:TetR/AcrR family transcriptional regulator, mexJK operon transcriptional repressor
MSSEDCTHSACTARILDAALQVFCEEGYGASIDAVANRAKVARQTIYNHFESKHALFQAALEHAAAELSAPLEADDGDLRERLVRFGLSFRARVLAPESIRLHRVLVSEAPRFPDLASTIYTNCILRTCQQVAALLERDGRLRRDDAFEAAQFFLDMLVGFDRLKLLFVGGAAPDAATEKVRVMRVVDRLLYGYAIVLENRAGRATG